MLYTPLLVKGAAFLESNQTNTSIIEDVCPFAYILEGEK